MDSLLNDEASDSADDGAGAAGVTFEDLTPEEQAALAEEMASPVVVPRHVLITLARMASLSVEAALKGNLQLLDELQAADLADVRPPTDEEREGLIAEGMDCPDELRMVRREVFTAINWAEIALDPDGAFYGEDTDEVEEAT